MSVIMNAIVYLNGNYTPNDELQMLSPIDAKYEVTQRFERVLDTYDDTGGSKSWIGQIYAAAFNHITVEELVQWWLTRDWTDNCAAVLVFDHEHKGVQTYIKQES